MISSSVIIFLCNGFQALINKIEDKLRRLILEIKSMNIREKNKEIEISKRKNQDFD